MAILTTAHVKGQTKEGYDGVLIGLQELIRKAPGFILHTSYPYEEGWVVAEIWETKADADAFFCEIRCAESACRDPPKTLLSRTA